MKIADLAGKKILLITPILILTPAPEARRAVGDQASSSNNDNDPKELATSLFKIRHRCDFTFSHGETQDQEGYDVVHSHFFYI